MSLSYWLRDYLYISLGGNRKGIKITYRNLMITMLLGGLWHGSSWNFIIWGGIHGLVLSCEKFMLDKKWLQGFKSVNFLGYFITFSIVLFAWIFFRAEDLTSAMLAVQNILKFDLGMPFIGNINTMANSIIVLTIGIMCDLYIKVKNVHLENLGANFSLVKIALFASICLTLISLFYSTSENFIYFQF